MTPEQTERLFSTLGRIEQKIDSHLEEDSSVHARQDRELNEQDRRIAANEKSIARARGIGAGAVSVLGILISIMGIDRFGG